VPQETSYKVQEGHKEIKSQTDTWAIALKKSPTINIQSNPSGLCSEIFSPLLTTGVPRICSHQ